MKAKLLAILVLGAWLFWFTVPTTACCEGDPPGSCYECVDGVWVEYGNCEDDSDCTGCESCQDCYCTDDNDNCSGCCICEDSDCVDEDDNCTGVQQCQDCNCVCDDPGEEWQGSSYSFDTSGITSKLESAINAIPKVECDSINFSLSVSAQERDICCDVNDTSYSKEYKLSANASGDISITIDLLGTKDFDFHKEWPGVGGVDANAVIDLGPIVEAEGQMELSGIFSPECRTGCISGAVSGSVDVGAKAQGSGSITVYTDIDWEWWKCHIGNLEFSIGFDAHGQATIGGSGEASYYYGDGCTEESEIGCCKIGTLTLSAGITFTICGHEYGVDSDEVVIWEGLTNGKCEGD